jgi:hypothetical protein
VSAAHVNYVTFTGQASITAAIDLLRRADRLQRPARVFYISDFDPTGEGMPRAVGRQVEFYIDRFAPGADLRLTPLALTRNQVDAYQLPRVPLKDSDRQKDKFEARHGQGAVELDALEALHPGVLADVVRRAVAPYRDTEYENKLTAAGIEASHEASGSWQGMTSDEAAELAQLRSEAEAICEVHGRALRRDLAGIRERLDDLRNRVASLVDEFEYKLPERPEAVFHDDDTDWLYDSKRYWLDQNEAYTRHSGGRP